MSTTTKRITLAYRCRDIGYGIEEGILTGHWTGEVDVWGKRTFQEDGGALHYFFPDEVDGEWDAGPLPERSTKHESVVCNMADGMRFDEGTGSHCCPLHEAAPDLLAAAKAVLEWAEAPGNHGGNPYGHRFVRLAEAAITKAEGNAP